MLPVDGYDMSLSAFLVIEFRWWTPIFLSVGWPAHLIAKAHSISHHALGLLPALIAASGMSKCSQ
jgi:hypothetical protein